MVNLVENGDASDEEADLVDERGIPVAIKHAPQSAFTAVWQFIHRPSASRPSPKRADSPSTHICTVSADDLKGKDTMATSFLVDVPTAPVNTEQREAGTCFVHTTTIHSLYRWRKSRGYKDEQKKTMTPKNCSLFLLIQNQRSNGPWWNRWLLKTTK